MIIIKWEKSTLTERDACLNADNSPIQVINSLSLILTRHNEDLGKPLDWLDALDRQSILQIRKITARAQKLATIPGKNKVTSQKD